MTITIDNAIQNIPPVLKPAAFTGVTASVSGLNKGPTGASFMRKSAGCIFAGGVCGTYLTGCGRGCHGWDLSGQARYTRLGRSLPYCTERPARGFRGHRFWQRQQKNEVASAGISVEHPHEQMIKTEPPAIIFLPPSLLLISIGSSHNYFNELRLCLCFTEVPRLILFDNIFTLKDDGYG
jgi:hypothetical protein